MLVHFCGSQWRINEQIDDLRRIVTSVHSFGHSLTRDWVEPTYQAAKSDASFAKFDWPTIYRENREAIARADVFIAEVSTHSFAVGFQAAIALQYKKPILLLARSEDVIETSFISGLNESLVTISIYDEKNIDKIIREFLEKNTIDIKDFRFNFFIDRPIYNYLRWTSLKTGKTKAEILRELVEREIDRSEL